MNIQKLNFKFIAALFASLFILAGCVTTPKAPEEAIVKTFLTAMAEADVETFFDSMYTEDGAGMGLEMMRPKFGELLKAYRDEEVTPRGGITSIDITEKEFSEDGKKADISYVINFGDGSTEEDTIPVINHDGVWKVNLDN